MTDTPRECPNVLSVYSLPCNVARRVMSFSSGYALPSSAESDFAQFASGGGQ